MVTTQSTNNDQITHFICSPESAHYPFTEAILKNLLRITLKIRTENFNRLFATDIFIPGDSECGNEELVI